MERKEDDDISSFLSEIVIFIEISLTSKHRFVNPYQILVIKKDIRHEEKRGERELCDEQVDERQE